MRKIVFEKVLKTIKKNNLLSKNDRVVIALSGGADSVSLAHLLSGLRNKYSLKLYLLHFRHGLRNKKEEGKDLKTVRNLAGRLFVPLTVKEINVQEFARRKKVGLEEAARILRYRYLAKFAQRYKYNKIATGHTLDDQAETVLLNLIRGSGLNGLSGIPVCRAENNFSIIRPLLKVTKNEILRYLQKVGLSYSQDFTNFQLDYTRNRIRNELIPLLEEYNPQIKKHLAHLAEMIAEDMANQGKISDIFLSGLLKKEKKKIKLDLRRFLDYNKTIQTGIIGYLLEHYGRRNFAHFTALSELLREKKSGKRIDLGQGWQAEKEGSRIYFWRIK